MNIFDFLSGLQNNPVYIKDSAIHKRSLSKKKWVVPSWMGYFAILLFPIIFGIVFMGTKLFSFTEESFEYFKLLFYVSFFIKVLYFGYRGISNSYYLITKEKENRTWMSLISGGMSGDEIIKGKLWSGFSHLAKEILYFLPLSLTIGLILKIPLHQVIMADLITWSVTLVISMLGLYCSATSPDSRSSRGKTIGILLMTILVIPMVCSIFFSGIMFMLPREIWFIVHTIFNMVINILNPFALVMTLFMSHILTKRLESGMGEEWSYLLSLGVWAYQLLTLWIYSLLFRLLWNWTRKEITRIPEK